MLLALIARFMTLPDKQQLHGFLRSQPDTTSTMFLLWLAEKEAQAVGEQKRVGTRRQGWVAHAHVYILDRRPSYCHACRYPQGHRLMLQMPSAPVH